MLSGSALFLPFLSYCWFRPCVFCWMCVCFSSSVIVARLLCLTFMGKLMLHAGRSSRTSRLSPSHQNISLSRSLFLYLFYHFITPPSLYSAFCGFGLNVLCLKPETAHPNSHVVVFFLEGDFLKNPHAPE